jgi:REP element-mobilizing transposase RayT
MSYTQLFYHIVIRTKYSYKTIPDEHSEDLYKYINGFVKNKKSVLYKVNGISDHIHLFVSLHPTIALSDFIRDLKTSTNKWMKSQSGFPDFTGWGRMYAAFTCNNYGIERLTNYITNQKEHHRKKPFEEEYRKLIQEAGIEINETYFLKDED